MIRELHLADLLTLANAACGVAAVFCAMAYISNQSLAYFFTATALAPAAFIFDVLDGRVARSRHTHSVFGRELDSLADVISFGVAPAALGFAAGINVGRIEDIDPGVEREPAALVTRHSLAEQRRKGFAQAEPHPLTGLGQRPFRLPHRAHHKIERVVDRRPAVDQGVVPVEDDRARMPLRRRVVGHAAEPACAK
jgi:hypothetical protein